MKGALGEWKDIYKEDPLEPFVENIMQITSSREITVFQAREEVRRVVAAICMYGRLAHIDEVEKDRKEQAQEKLDLPHTL